MSSRCLHRIPTVLLILLAGIGGLGNSMASETIRVAVLKFGTVNWELETVLRNGFDREEGFALEVVPLAGKQATLVALQSGNVRMAVTDWLWVSRQRTQGQPWTFVPYSTAAGALVTRPGNGIEKLADLKGRRLGVAGGSLDKSWLLFQALARRQLDGLDLSREATVVHGAPPLLNQQLLQGRIDAVINFWPYVARLEAAGMRRILDVKQALHALGITQEIPIIGYVFDEKWAKTHQRTLKAFLRATTRARELLKSSDQAWEALRPLMNAGDEDTFRALREGYRAGIPDAPQLQDLQAAEKLFALLYQIGGSRLAGDSRRLAPGTFWTDSSD